MNYNDGEEIARVGFAGDLEVFVSTDDECEIPHAHIRIKSIGFETCVRLDDTAYCESNIYRSQLDEESRVIINEFMRAPSKHEPEKTNYQVAVVEWNRNNSSTDVEIKRGEDGNIIIPDYTKLK